VGDDQVATLRRGGVCHRGREAEATLDLIAWRIWTSQEEGRRQWHEWLLRLPILGDLRHGIVTSHLAAALSALLATGVPIATALRVTAGVTGDSAIAHRILRARDSVTTGQSLERALRQEQVATPGALRLIGAGEQSGSLAGMLSHAARLEDERVQLRIRSLLRLLEPALLIGFAGFVALAAAALLQAVYSVRPTT